MKLTRRDFLKNLALLSSLTIQQLHAKNHTYFDLSFLDVYMPEYLFENPKSSKDHIKLLGVSDTHLDNHVTFIFQKGYKKTVDKDLNSEHLQHSFIGKSIRESMLIRRIFSYVIDMTYKKTIRKKRAPLDSEHIKRDFDNLQREEILHKITIRELLQFVRAMQETAIVSYDNENQSLLNLESYPSSERLNKIKS